MEKKTEILRLANQIFDHFKYLPGYSDEKYHASHKLAEKIINGDIPSLIYKREN